MIRFHIIAVAAMAAATLGASGASAMPIRDVIQPVGPEESGLLLPDRVDAAAHAATIRGIGAARLDRLP
jgi:hypothetical protein